MILESDRGSIRVAAAILRKGGLVAFPTETVYGLGANALDAVAVRKIFEAKGRPVDNPLIVHIASRKQLAQVVHSIPAGAGILIDFFWPGPLSLVLPRSQHIPAVVSAGLPSVAVRMPDHKEALALISAAGVPVAAPSANRSGRPSPTSYRHVLDDLSGRIDAVIKSDFCRVGVESTVLDLTGSRPVILRPGGVSREELERVSGQKIYLAGIKDISKRPISPGMKYRHYSPKAPLYLITGSEYRRRRLISAFEDFYRRRGKKVGVLETFMGGSSILKHDEGLFASRLYEALRAFDRLGVTVILAEEKSTAGIGLAVMNRLRKAATRVLRA